MKIETTSRKTKSARGRSVSEEIGKAPAERQGFTDEISKLEDVIEGEETHGKACLDGLILETLAL